jgi:hypothetical protein
MNLRARTMLEKEMQSYRALGPWPARLRVSICIRVQGCSLERHEHRYMTHERRGWLPVATDCGWTMRQYGVAGHGDGGFPVGRWRK